MKDYRAQAVESLPKYYFVLPSGTPTRNEDLLWSWSSREFLRKDSPLWNCSIVDAEVICAVRSIQNAEFAERVPTRKVFTVKKFEPLQANLF